jgi:hypothetical protein
MNGTQACVSCGAVVTPATSFLSENGVVCTACLQRREAAQQDEARTAAARDIVRLARAGQLAWLHAVNWGTGLILLAGWGHLPGWLDTVLIGGALVLSFALGFRNALAFRAALALDTAGALALLVASAILVSGAQFLVLLFPALFAGWLGWLLWRARDVFAPEGFRLG